MQYEPDGHQIVLVKSSLSEHLLGYATLDEPGSLLIPSAEDLIVALLLVGSESPRDWDGGLTGVSLILLLELLLERMSGVGGELHLSRVHVGRRLSIGCGHEGGQELGGHGTTSDPTEATCWLGPETGGLRLLERGLLVERRLLREASSHRSLHGRSKAGRLSLQGHLRSQSPSHEARRLWLL